MNSRRDRLEVIADILAEALYGANKTQIMYRANLNFLRINRYFSELLDSNLISKVNSSDGRVFYRTTEKGRAFLKAMRRIKELTSM